MKFMPPLTGIEVICTKCNGLGEERWMKRDILPQHNVYGWYTTWEKDHYWRRCEACDGTGFRPSGTSVPTISQERSKSP